MFTPNADLDVAYGFYAPSGRFEQGDPDNLRLGFWATALVMAVTYELHHTATDYAPWYIAPADHK
jgi:hypothetical protein